MFRATADGFNARQRHSGRGLGASRPAEPEPDLEVVALRRARALRDGLADIERQHGNLSQQYTDALVEMIAAARTAMELGDEPFETALIHEETAIFEDGIARAQALAPRSDRVRAALARYGEQPVRRGGGMATRYRSSVRHGGAGLRVSGGAFVPLTSSEYRKRARVKAPADRHTRSEMYAETVALINAMYSGPRRGEWKAFSNAIAAGGRQPDGTIDVDAAAVYRTIRRLYGDAQGRVYALLLVQRAARNRGALLYRFVPWLEAMSALLGFRLTVMPGVEDAISDVIDVDGDGGGILVRPGTSRAERDAAQAMLTLGA